MDDMLLAHHGIKGQKWGVRRYQNEDGTLTAAGKRRDRANRDTDTMSHTELKSEVQRMNLEKQYKKLSKELVDPTRLESTKKVVDSMSEFARKAQQIGQDSPGQKKGKKPRLDLSEMSDKELRERINRELMERQYSDLFAKPETVSRGESFVNKALENVGTVLSVAGSALSVALAIRELTKGKG